MNKLDEKIKDELTRLEIEQDTDTLRDVLWIVGNPNEPAKPPNQSDLYLDDPEDF
jgi:hypothetical protein